MLKIIIPITMILALWRMRYLHSIEEKALNRSLMLDILRGIDRVHGKYPAIERIPKLKTGQGRQFWVRYTGTGGYREHHVVTYIKHQPLIWEPPLPVPVETGSSKEAVIDQMQAYISSLEAQVSELKDERSPPTDSDLSLKALKAFEQGSI